MSFKGQKKKKKTSDEKGGKKKEKEREKMRGRRLQTSLGTGLSELNLVLLGAAEEVLSALALLDVLDSDVDLLPHDLVAHALVDLDSDSAGGDVPDATSLSVVVLVGHTLVDGRVGLDGDVVSKTEGGQVGGDVGGTLSTESPLKEVACVASVTLRTSHFLW